jgi:hypothetical protein
MEESHRGGHPSGKELSQNVEACRSRTEAQEIEARHQRGELEKSLTHLKNDKERARDARFSH